jgi:hypothetical protein
MADTPPQLRLCTRLRVTEVTEDPAGGPPVLSGVEVLETSVVGPDHTHPDRPEQVTAGDVIYLDGLLDVYLIPRPPPPAPAA